VLGPLPTIYRIIVSVCALAACAGLGAWLTSRLPGSFLAPTGAGIGAAIGVVAVLLLLHDSDHDRQRRVHVSGDVHRDDGDSR
jgi:hypothetical protein